jgi:hypothetical protein
MNGEQGMTESTPGCKINDTTDYHLYELATLGWELTICNALHPPNSPCRQMLRRRESYGRLLYDHLRRLIPMADIRHLLEIGGGYGYLTKDFLRKNRFLKATLLDLSPYLLQRQRTTLRRHQARFIQADIIYTDVRDLRGYDLAVLNENLGDLPTLIGVEGGIFGRPPEELAPPLQRVRRIFEQYQLEQPASETFNLNIGALELVEKLCTAAIPYVFLSEHSCEAVVPDDMKRFLRFPSPGNTEQIRLRGHDEYTVKFSYLEAIARACGYQTVRGCFAEFLEFDFTDKVRYIMTSASVDKDEHEIIRHFIEDLYKYEYLVFVRTS